MTFRMATPEETKALFGKPLILFGVKPPASSGTTSTSTAVETPEAVSQFLPCRPMPPDPTDGMERQAMERLAREKIEFPDRAPTQWFVPPTNSSTVPAPYEFTEEDREMAEALGFAWPPARLEAASSPSGWMMPMPEH